MHRLERKKDNSVTGTLVLWSFGVAIWPTWMLKIQIIRTIMQLAEVVSKLTIFTSQTAWRQQWTATYSKQARSCDPSDR